MICMAIAQVSVTPPAKRDASAICGRAHRPSREVRQRSPVPAIGRSRAQQGLGASGSTPASVLESLRFREQAPACSGVGEPGAWEPPRPAAREQRPGDDALLDPRSRRWPGRTCNRCPRPVRAFARRPPRSAVDRVGQQVAFVRAQLVEVPHLRRPFSNAAVNAADEFRQGKPAAVFFGIALGTAAMDSPVKVRAQRIRARGHGAALVADDVLEDTAFDDASVGHVAKGTLPPADSSVVRHAAVERAARSGRRCCSRGRDRRWLRCRQTCRRIWVPPPVVVSSSLLVTELGGENAPPAMSLLLRILPLNVPPSMVPKLSISSELNVHRL